MTEWCCRFSPFVCVVHSLWGRCGWV